MHINYNGYRIPDSSCSLDRIDPNSMDPKTFFERYVSTRTPCILNQLPSPSTTSTDCKPWDWLSLAWLVKHAGNAIVSVERKDASIDRFGSGKKRELIKLDDLVKLLETGEQDVYMTTQYDNHEEVQPELTSNRNESMSGLEEHDSLDCNDKSDTYSHSDLDSPSKISDYASPPLDSVVKHIPISLNLFGNLIPHLMNLWIGSSTAAQGTSSGLHHDFHDNFYLLKSGAKQFTIFSPDDTDAMYLNGNVVQVHENGLQEYADTSSHGVRADGAFLYDVASYQLQIAQDAMDIAITPSEIELAEKNLDYAMQQILDYQDPDNESIFSQDADDTQSDVEVAQNHPVSLTQTKKRNTHATLENVQPSLKKVKTHQDTPIQLPAPGKSESDPPSFSRIPIQILDKFIAGQPPPNQFGKLANATGIRFKLNAGEALYLPGGWFHEVRSFSSSNSTEINPHLALNFWLEPPTTNNFDNPYPDHYWRDIRWKPLQECMANATR
ncbi:hypothetical protein RTP6_007399 [Batrachochytrium dendrobatidis]